MGKAKVPVTMRALIQRINRKLAQDDEMLRTARGERAKMDAGDFYIIDFRLNALVRHDVDPEALGRKLGVLRPWEEVAS